MVYEDKPRGMLTDETKAKAEEYLGREFTQKELRLYPGLVIGLIFVCSAIFTYCMVTYIQK